MRNRLRSYLSDNGVRLAPKTPLASDPQKVKTQVQSARSWTSRQWQVIEGLFLELVHADQQRRHWRGLIAQEVLTAVQLCGVRDLTAFALVAIIGDIKRFARPGSLVKYLGLNPAFDDSGQEKWTGGIGGHGRKDLRCLLIEGAQAIPRCARTLRAQWGRKLLARKGQKNLVVAAMARKLAVALWYLLRGLWTPLEQIDLSVEIKIGKIITQVAPAKELAAKVGKSRSAYYQEIAQRLQAGRVYILDPHKKFTPKPAPSMPSTLAQEYGLV